MFRNPWALRSALAICLAPLSVAQLQYRDIVGTPDRYTLQYDKTVTGRLEAFDFNQDGAPDVMFVDSANNLQFVHSPARYPNLQYVMVDTVDFAALPPTLDGARDVLALSEGKLRRAVFDPASGTVSFDALATDVSWVNAQRIAVAVPRAGADWEADVFAVSSDGMKVLRGRLDGMTFTNLPPIVSSAPIIALEAFDMDLLSAGAEIAYGTSTHLMIARNDGSPYWAPIQALNGLKSVRRLPRGGFAGADSLVAVIDIDGVSDLVTEIEARGVCYGMTSGGRHVLDVTPRYDETTDSYDVVVSCSDTNEIFDTSQLAPDVFPNCLQFDAVPDYCGLHTITDSGFAQDFIGGRVVCADFDGDLTGDFMVIDNSNEGAAMFYLLNGAELSQSGTPALTASEPSDPPPGGEGGSKGGGSASIVSGFTVDLDATIDLNHPRNWPANVYPNKLVVEMWYRTEGDAYVRAPLFAVETLDVPATVTPAQPTWSILLSVNVPDGQVDNTVLYFQTHWLYDGPLVSSPITSTSSSWLAGWEASEWYANCIRCTEPSPYDELTTLCNGTIDWCSHPLVPQGAPLIIGFTRRTRVGPFNINESPYQGP